jgi:hypothetical protein
MLNISNVSAALNNMKFKEETFEVLHLECSSLCGVEIGAVRKLDQKYQQSFGMWC